MRARAWVIVPLIVGLLASVVIAKTPTRMDLEKFSRINRIHGPAFTDRSTFQGFESAVPPSGWTATGTNEYTWEWTEMVGGSVEGDHAAFIHWNETVAQDEALSFSQTIDVAGGEYVLSFWMAGSRGEDWDLNVSETVEVDGVEVFDFDSADNTGVSFLWEQHFIDLSAYDGQTVDITFRYAGVDGDGHFLDAVMVDDGTGYTPVIPDPPENDLCENAVLVSGTDQYVVDLCTAVNDYDADEYDSSCTGYGSTGPDVVYKVYLHVGEAFTATVAGDFDAVLWLVTDCSDPAATCVIGADEVYENEGEQIPPTDDPSWTPDTEGWYYLIVDSYGGDCNEATIDIDAPVATDKLDWGQVKTLYR